jgi:hypothetical protein
MVRQLVSKDNADRRLIRKRPGQQIVFLTHRQRAQIAGDQFWEVGQVVERTTQRPQLKDLWRRASDELVIELGLDPLLVSEKPQDRMRAQCPTIARHPTQHAQSFHLIEKVLDDRESVDLVEGSRPMLDCPVAHLDRRDSLVDAAGIAFCDGSICHDAGNELVTRVNLADGVVELLPYELDQVLVVESAPDVVASDRVDGSLAANNLLLEIGDEAFAKSLHKDRIVVAVTQYSPGIALVLELEAHGRERTRD